MKRTKRTPKKSNKASRTSLRGRKDIASKILNRWLEERMKLLASQEKQISIVQKSIPSLTSKAQKEYIQNTYSNLVAIKDWDSLEKGLLFSDVIKTLMILNSRQMRTLV